MILFVFGALTVWHTSHSITVGIRTFEGSDAWFNADAERVFYNMSARNSDQYRSQVHPIFAIVANPACFLFHKLLRLDLNDSADLFLALTAGIWMALMYIVCRQLGFDRSIAFMASILGMSTTSAFLFFSVPETYGLSSVSILATLAIFLFASRTSREPWGDVLASAASLSMTVTNWSLGLLLSLRRRRFRRWVQTSINAFFLITVLWTMERAFMPTAQFFTAIASERQFLRRLTPLEIVHTAAVVVSHTVVAPQPVEVESFGPEEGTVGPPWMKALSIQGAWPGDGSMVGVSLALLWLLALTSGILTLTRETSNLIARPVLIFLALQLLLHVLYGAETILYSLDWMPVLVIIGAYGIRRFAGRLSWAAMMIFVALIAWHNYGQFRYATRLVDAYQGAHPLLPPSQPEQMIPSK